MTSLIDKKFTQDEFDRKKEAYFDKFEWDFNPFAQKDPLPDPELLVPHQVKDVQELIDLVTEGDLVSFIVSKIGMGKTTLCKFLDNALPEQEDENIVSVFLHGPSIDNGEQMLRIILERLELRSKEGDVAMEFEQLRNWHQDYSDFTLNIIIDEFPDINEKSLNMVRSLADLEGIVMILNGQENELEDFVKDNAPALYERRRHTLRLEPLTRDELRELVMYRMAWARGGDYERRIVKPFTEEAIDELHEKSDGVPRRALKLAGDSVYNMVDSDEMRITPELVHERDKKTDEDVEPDEDEKTDSIESVYADEEEEEVSEEEEASSGEEVKTEDEEEESPEEEGGEEVPEVEESSDQEDDETPSEEDEEEEKTEDEEEESSGEEDEEGFWSFLGF